MNRLLFGYPMNPARCGSLSLSLDSSSIDYLPHEVQCFPTVEPLKPFILEYWKNGKLGILSTVGW